MDGIQKDTPPQYTESVASVDIEQPDVGVQAQVTGMDFFCPELIVTGRLTVLSPLGDGRIAIDINRRSSIFSSFRNQNQEQIKDLVTEISKPAPPPFHGQSEDISVLTTQKLEPQTPPSPLNIVIHVVGSRGDVQPFVALGQVLKSTYKHRVRIATHPIFKSFVEQNGLEFFSIGGDPKEFMAFMVRSPGLLPRLDALRGGDVARHREMVGMMMEGCWRACIEEGDGMREMGEAEGEERRTGKGGPFVADVIVANPPSFAHIHCGQKLGVPVHLMFT